MKKLLKLAIPAFLLAAAFSMPTTAQTPIAPDGCPSGTFKCTCNGVESCRSSIQDCWNSC